MEKSKHDNNTLVYDPFHIRPGLICDVTVLYMMKLEIPVWDSDTTFQTNIVGFTDVHSITSPDININVNSINIIKNESDITLQVYPTYKGEVALVIYYYQTVDQVITTRAAFNVSHHDYYKDYVERNNVIIPKTVVELQDISGSYKIQDVKINVRKENTGIAYMGESLIELDSSGLFKYKEEYLYVLNKGIQQVKVPLDSDITAIRKEGGKKVIEINNQEWKDGYSATYGLILYNDSILMLTNKSLCVFNMYSDLKLPILEDENIRGTDLTYVSDDTILVANGNKLYKYKVRHNNIWIDKDDRRVFFREPDPNITIKNI